MTALAVQHVRIVARAADEKGDAQNRTTAHSSFLLGHKAKLRHHGLAQCEQLDVSSASGVHGRHVGVDDADTLERHEIEPHALPRRVRIVCRRDGLIVEALRRFREPEARSTTWEETPVVFPPGLARLLTRPSPTGSALMSLVK